MIKGAHVGDRVWAWEGLEKDSRGWVTKIRPLLMEITKVERYSNMVVVELRGLANSSVLLRRRSGQVYREKDGLRQLLLFFRTRHTRVAICWSGMDRAKMAAELE